MFQISLKKEKKIAMRKKFNIYSTYCIDMSKRKLNNLTLRFRGQGQ